jgi:5-methylcytosine-specific restriction protein A
MNWAITPFCRFCQKHRSIKGKRYCLSCQPTAEAADRKRINANKTDKLRSSATEREHHRFYSSKKWRAVRLEKLAMNPLCQDCEERGLVNPGQEIDHVRRLKDGGARFDYAILRTLCSRCHARKRAKEGHGTLLEG